MRVIIDGVSYVEDEGLENWLTLKDADDKIIGGIAMHADYKITERPDDDED